MSWTASVKIFPENEQDFPHYASPATLQVAAGTGGVELQHRDPAGNWATFETISVAGVHKLDVANMPAIRLVATGDAQYQVTWQIA
ncbi:hypothetical protein [Tropicimonas sp. IMCC6043]|uniref:hypothetical protein n=1 Tax=Tropicimonas sp. IMCC6043 TaxID=2510645 RepID=UPI00101C71DB|nr:hypothetical protein [Tropicimonas sp. IMCC6043]RYH10102.1 hypothetical protein EU800_09445 [Tropicimonas sp. IMCC6043]